MRLAFKLIFIALFLFGCTKKKLLEDLDKTHIALDKAIDKWFLASQYEKEKAEENMKATFDVYVWEDAVNAIKGGEKHYPNTLHEEYSLAEAEAKLREAKVKERKTDIIHIHAIAEMQKAEAEKEKAFEKYGKAVRKYQKRIKSRFPFF